MNRVVDFGPEFFANNRRRLREVFGGQAPIVIAAHAQLQRTADQTYPFQQNSNFWYLTGVDMPDYVLVMDKTRDYLIAPERSDYQQIFHGDSDTDSALSISGIDEVLEYKTGWKRLNRRLKLAKYVATTKPAPSYIETYGFYTNPAQRRLVKNVKAANPNIELLDIRLHLAQLRMIKSEPELQAMKHAIDHSIKAFSLVRKNFKNYNNETDIAREISQYYVQNDLKEAYPTIAANGLRATTLHYEANDGELDQRSITLIDAGASYGRYCADLTRSYCLEPAKRQQQVYDAVLAIQEYAIGLIKPGVLLKDYEQSVMLYTGEKLRALGLIRTISKDTVRQYAPHSTSHFLGLDTHDAADIELPLSPGMVLTVEPGIYIKDESIGVRIEDDILVTKTSNKNLSANLPKSLTHFL